MKDKEALKLALKALKHTHPSPLTSFYTIGDRDKAIKAIEEHLAQPEHSAPHGEPVAWMEGESVYWHTNPSLNDWIRANGTPLYTTPPQRTWVGLTDEDKKEYAAQDFGGNRLDAMDWAEKRLKEKNT